MKKKTLIFVLATVAILAWIILQVIPPFTRPFASNRTVADLQPPSGYKRVTAEPGSAAEFYRSLPLRKAGTPMHLNTGGLSRLQFLSYAVIDLPLLSNSEQCADVCMRLRAEYLYHNRRYLHICNETVSGVPMLYLGGASRKALEVYLRSVYEKCNTASMRKQLKQRPLSEVQPGDVLVYGARSERMYGHAIQVLDVAVNKKGKKMILCAEGNTPARDMHVVRHGSGCWIPFNPKAKTLIVSCYRFDASDLRHW